ncbi:MAG: hypothetical protein IPL79_13195 [Myxococcales bacterium]|nr:hypothetical protein [Myxococcales bacterium]
MGWPYRVAWLSLGLFVAAALAAMLTYGGGHWHDASATRFSLAYNYFCDQFDAISIAGRNNAMSRGLAHFAIFALAVCQAAVWWLVPRGLADVATTRRRLLRTCQVAGVASAVALPFILVPWWSLHKLAIFVAGPAGVAALIGVNWTLWVMASPAQAALARRAANFVRVSGLALAIIATVGLTDYLGIVLLEAPRTMLLPIIQRLGLVAMTAWLGGMLLLMNSLAALPTTNHPTNGAR